MRDTNKIHAASISRPAAALMANQTGSGKVHSVFSRAVNVETDSVLLTVADQALLNLPFGILCDFERLGNSDLSFKFRNGEPVEIARNELLFPLSGVHIDCSLAPRWEPHLRLSLGRISHAAIRVRVEHVQRIVAHQSETYTSPAMLALTPESSSPLNSNDYSTTLQRQMLEGLDLFVNGLRHDSAKQILTGANQLLGLGHGLTPSGDDVLAGLLTTLAVASNDCLRTRTLAVATQIAEQARQCTTDISVSFLRFASQGYVTERFKNLLTSVIKGTSGLENNTRRMISFGATSGIEAVVGMLLGLELLLEQIDEPPRVYEITSLLSV